MAVSGPGSCDSRRRGPARCEAGELLPSSCSYHSLNTVRCPGYKAWGMAGELLQQQVRGAGAVGRRRAEVNCSPPPALITVLTLCGARGFKAWGMAGAGRG